MGTTHPSTSWSGYEDPDTPDPEETSILSNSRKEKSAKLYNEHQGQQVETGKPPSALPLIEFEFVDRRYSKNPLRSAAQ